MEPAIDRNRYPDIASLRRIRNLSRFNNDQLGELATRLELRDAMPGECLIERGCSDAFSLYLIDGALEAVAHNGEVTRHESSADGELLPIAQIRPSMYQVVAVSPARYVTIGAELMNKVARLHEVEAQAADMDVVELDQTEEVNALTKQLFQDLLSGNLKLPSLPNVAHRIQQAFADDSVDAEIIGKLIQADPAITAKLIMIANSALYRGQAPIESFSRYNSNCSG